MILIQRWLVIGLVLIGAGAVGCEPVDPPPPTRPPAEPAVTYSGRLEGVEGQIALIVTATRAVGFVCGQGSDWKLISAWLSDGQVTPLGALTLKGDSPARLITAKVNPNQIVGGYTTGNKTYAFQAIPVADQESIRAGARQGVYRLEIPLSGQSGGSALFTLLVPDAAQDALCGVLFEDGAARSRVSLSGVWQEGLSTFILPDLLNQDGTPTVWFGVGTLGQIDSILLP